MIQPKARSRVGGSDPLREDAKDDADSEPPPTYLFELLGYDELAQEESGSIGLSPPAGYHLHSWKVGDEAIAVCWEHDDA